MTTNKEAKLNILTPADRLSLEKLSDQIVKAEKTIDLLEQLGIGVGELKAKLVWSKERTALLLEKG